MKKPPIGSRFRFGLERPRPLAGDDIRVLCFGQEVIGFIVATNHPVLGTMYRQGTAVQFSETPGRAEGSPLQGEHTRAILREAGFSDGEIAGWKEKGVIGWEAAVEEMMARQ